MDQHEDCVTVFLADPSDSGVLSDGDTGAATQSLEPSAKRMRHDEAFTTETITIDWNDDNVKQTLYNVNRALTLRLDEMERKYDILLRTVQDMNRRSIDGPSNSRGRGSAIVVGLPQSGSTNGSGSDEPRQAFSAPGGNVTLITLNSEQDYPNGVWLGDENNPEMRVRVGITPSDLLHIHSNCRTAEKMALTLLDYLFDRDTQASSNLSGTGKHGKKQLDPLKIYGIRCHLIHRFRITESDWHRIRLNVDSKCRTAYRRKMKGQPMNVKAFRAKDALGSPDGFFATVTTDSSQGLDDNHLQIQQGLSLDGSDGELQIIHATEEQLVQLQQSHQIQILEDSQVPAELLQHLQQQAGGDHVQVAISSLDPESHTDDGGIDSHHTSQLQIADVDGNVDLEDQHSNTENTDNGEHL